MPSESENAWKDDKPYGGEIPEDKEETLVETLRNLVDVQKRIIKNQTTVIECLEAILSINQETIRKLTEKLNET